MGQENAVPAASTNKAAKNVEQDAVAERGRAAALRAQADRVDAHADELERRAAELRADAERLLS